MAPNSTKLSQKQLLAIAYLKTGKTIQKSADLVGVHERTVDRWLTLRHFSEALEEAKVEYLKEVQIKEIEAIRADTASDGQRLHSMVDALIGKIEEYLTTFEFSDLRDSDKIKMMERAESLLQRSYDMRSEAWGVGELLNKINEDLAD